MTNAIEGTGDRTPVCCGKSLAYCPLSTQMLRISVPDYGLRAKNSSPNCFFTLGPSQVRALYELIRINKRPSKDGLLFMVEVTGLEPAASCSQSKRATNCATPLNIGFHNVGTTTLSVTLCVPRLAAARSRRRSDITP